MADQSVAAAYAGRPQPSQDEVYQARLDEIARNERELQQLRAQVAAKQKAQTEAPPRTPLQRFVDNLVDGAQHNLMLTFARRSQADPAFAIQVATAGNYVAGPANPVTLFALSNAVAGRVIDKIVPGFTQSQVQEEQQRRADFAQRSASDPWYNAPGGVPGKLVAGAATLAGQLVGGAADPINLVGPEGSVGKVLATKGLSAAASLAAKKAAGQGLLNAVNDAAEQATEMGQLRDHFDPIETLSAAAVGVGLSASLDVAPSTVRALVAKFRTPDAGRAPLSLAEVPPVEPPPVAQHEPSPALLPAPVEAPARKPAEAHQAPSATHLPAVPEKPAGDRSSGSSESSQGAGAGDPWSEVDWGKMRSKQRAQAAVEHLDKLRQFIKPEHVRDFVNALDQEVNPELPIGDRVGFVNPEYVNWDHMESNPEDFLAWVNIRSAIFKDLYDRAGDAGKTWDQIGRMAALMGQNLSDLIKTHADITGEGGIAARVGALAQTALESADRFHAQLKDVRAQIERGDLSGVSEFAAAVQRTVLLEAMSEGATSEIARALNYMRKLKRPKAAVNDLQSLLNEFGDAVNGGKPVDIDKVKRTMDAVDKAYRARGAAGVVEEVAKMRQLGLEDYIGYHITAGLLSKPATWIRNLIGTPFMSVFNIAERYVGAGIGAAREAIGLGSRERMTLAEANAYVASSVEALHDAFGNAWKAWKSGTTITDDTGSWAGEALQRPVPFQLNKDRLDRWARDGMTFHTVLDAAMTAYFEVLRTVGFRFSVAADEFYKAITHHQQISGLAYREAHYRASLADPKDYAKVFQKTLQDIQQKPTAAAFKEARRYFTDREMDPDGVYPVGSREEELALLIRSVDLEKMAADHARMMVFQDAGPIVTQIDRTLRTIPLIKWFYVPFFRTPMALLRAGMIDRNPLTLGLLGENRKAFGRLIETAKNDEAAMERGGAEADLAMARLIVGGTIMSMAFMLWANGHLVGRRGQPGNPASQDGIRDYSLRLPNGTWVQFSQADPLGSILGLTADVAQTMRDRRLDDNQASALVGGVFAAIRNNVLEKSALTGIKDFFDTFYGTYSQKDATGGKAVAEGLSQSALSLYPLSSLVRGVAQDMDPVKRDAHSLIDQIKAMTPLWSEDLPARRDAFGRPLVRKPGERGIAQAFATSKLSDDPLDLEESRLGTVIPDFTLKPASRSFNGRPITPEEYSRVLEVQGQLFRNPRTGLNMEEAALSLIASPRYAQMGDLQRAHELKALVTQYREAANAAIKNPRSAYYMPDMVRRTATEKVTQEAQEKGLRGARMYHRARVLGMTSEDMQKLKDLFSQ